MSKIKSTNTAPNPEPETAACSCCGIIHPLSELTLVGSYLYCADCLDRETVVCSHCGCRVLIDENAGTGDFPLCEKCYNDHYTYCHRCGCIISQDNAYYEDEDGGEAYCAVCYRVYNSQGGIEDYYYKPDPIFYGNGTRYFGVELEVDSGGEIDDNAEDVIAIGNRKANHIYCKHDGSLDDGFEIVTHPCTLDYHTNTLPWRAMLDELKDMDYLSHQANTCGLHVHVNRNSFGETVEEQDACIARILYFFEKHWDELLKFSRRTARQLDRWAARYGYKDHPKDMLEHAKKDIPCGRYYCINLQNCETIEFRIFRGTLKCNTLIATLQLVNRVCEVAQFMSDEEIRQMSWTTFVSGCTQPELVRYLKERRLYVNEPIVTEEEV